LQTALQFDYEGVAENATRLTIPHFTLQISELTEASIGELLSFLHYYTVYSALLREQDPFDQPEVEASKKVSFEKRKQFSRS
jgi:glucose-6-phosphate isomerase